MQASKSRSRNPAGRTAKPIDVEQVEALAAIQCTVEEMAAVLGVSRAQLFRRMKEKAIAEAIESGREKGKMSIRRAQFRALEKGQPTMLVWLGKQHLGQRDFTALEHSGPGGGPIENSLTVEDARTQLRRLITEGAERLQAAKTHDVVVEEVKEGDSD